MRTAGAGGSGSSSRLYIRCIRLDGANINALKCANKRKAGREPDFSKTTRKALRAMKTITHLTEFVGPRELAGGHFCFEVQ